MIEEFVDTALRVDPSLDQDPEAAPVRVHADEIREDLVEKPPEQQGGAFSDAGGRGTGGPAQRSSNVSHRELETHDTTSAEAGTERSKSVATPATSSKTVGGPSNTRQ